MSASVLIFSSDPAADPCVGLVAPAIARRGFTPVVVNPSGFPAEQLICFDPLSGRCRLGDVDLSDARSAWMRHVHVGDGLPELRPDWRSGVLSVAGAAFWSMIECLPVFHLDPASALLSAPRKPRQMQLATGAGLDVPRTLVTSDADAVRAFAATCPDGVIYKLIESGALDIADSEGPAFPTRLLTDEELADLGGLQLSPMIFQERVRKVEELRITVVGPAVFVAATPGGDSVDVRTDPANIRGYRRASLPARVEAAVLRLLDRMRLNFATLDMLHSPDDRYVLIEVNTVSFFDHVEIYAGLPVSDAVADLLTGAMAPRI